MVSQKNQLSEPSFYSIKLTKKLSAEEIRILTNFFNAGFSYKDHLHYSLLEGEVKDQAALSGLISFLTDLHCIVLSVTQV